MPSSPRRSDRRCPRRSRPTASPASSAWRRCMPAKASNVTVAGDGLPANQEFDLVWRTVKGSWKAENGQYHGRDYAPVGYRIARVKTDGAGRFAASFIAPDDFGFQHDIVLQQGTKLLTQAGYHARHDAEGDAARTDRPARRSTLDIKGIGWRELENSWMLLYDNNFTGWISAVSTHGSAHFTIPATGPVGKHVLQLIHGEFTFPYMNPQQNPVPDRPRFECRFHDHAWRAPCCRRRSRRRRKRACARCPTPGALVATPRFRQRRQADHGQRRRLHARARATSCNGRTSPAIASSPAAGRSAPSRSPKRKPMRAASSSSVSTCPTISAARIASSVEDGGKKTAGRVLARSLGAAARRAGCARRRHADGPSERRRLDRDREHLSCRL